MTTTLLDRSSTSPNDRPAEAAPPGPEPLVYVVKDLLLLLQISLADFHRKKAAGKIPRELPRAGNGKLRYNAAEIRAWVAAGTPDRKTWEAMLKAKNGQR